MNPSLVQAVVRVLHDVAGVVPELFADRYEVHGDEEGRERDEAEGRLPTDGLERRHVVLGHELLLIDHLRGDDDLRAHDEDVAEEDVGGWLVSLGVIASYDVSEVFSEEEGFPFDSSC